MQKAVNLEDYLGCNIRFSQDDEVATMLQPHVIKKLKNKFEMITHDLKYKDLPCTAGSVTVREFDDGERLDDKEQSLHRSGIGILLYLAKYTRPDIANGVRKHSKNMDKASKNDYKTLL